MAPEWRSSLAFGVGYLLMLLVADADHARRSEWVVVPSHRFGHVEIPLIL